MIMTKDERIQKETERLKKIFKDIPKNEFDTVIKLIDNVAFMSVTLEDLIEKINTEPLVVETVNGSQSFSKENPAITSYNKMYSNFNKGMQQLISLFPQDTGKSSTDEPEDELKKYLEKKSKKKLK